MSLFMNLKHTAPISELIRLHPCFSDLRDKAVWEYDTDVLEDYFSGLRTSAPQNDTYRWEVPDTDFFGHRQQAAVLPVMFIGKTGYGKSSLLNRIVGHDVFPTDDARSCTKKIDAAFYQLKRNSDSYLSLSDLPGVGENEQADQQYMEWYTGLLACSPCVIYVLRADQRDFSMDDQIFQALFRQEGNRDKVIITLNYADKIEPVNRNLELSEKQLEALDRKTELVSKLFNLPFYQIFSCCAQTGFGVEKIVEEIADRLEDYVFEED